MIGFVLALSMTVIDMDLDKNVPVGIWCDPIGETGTVRAFHRSRLWYRSDDLTGWAVLGVQPSSIDSQLAKDLYNFTSEPTLIGNLCSFWGLPRVWKAGFSYFRVLEFDEGVEKAIKADLPIDARLQDSRHTVHPWAIRGTLIADHGERRYLIKNKDSLPPGAPILMIEHMDYDN